MNWDVGLFNVWLSWCLWVLELILSLRFRDPLVYLWLALRWISCVLGRRWLGRGCCDVGRCNGFRLELRLRESLSYIRRELLGSLSVLLVMLGLGHRVDCYLRYSWLVLFDYLGLGYRYLWFLVFVYFVERSYRFCIVCELLYRVVLVTLFRGTRLGVDHVCRLY